MFINSYCKLSLGGLRTAFREPGRCSRAVLAQAFYWEKFVPGLSTFVVPVAGFSGMTYARFFVNDGGGIGLWALSMIAIGYTCEEWVLNLGAKAGHAKWFLTATMAVILACYYAVKIRRLRKFERAVMSAAHVAGQEPQQAQREIEELILVK
jgi:hypothetical protein